MGKSGGSCLCRRRIFFETPSGGCGARYPSHKNVRRNRKVFPCSARIPNKIRIFVNSSFPYLTESSSPYEKKDTDMPFGAGVFRFSGSGADPDASGRSPDGAGGQRAAGTYFVEKRAPPPENGRPELPLQHSGRAELYSRFRAADRRERADDVQNQSERHYDEAFGGACGIGFHVQRRAECFREAATLFQGRPFPHFRTIFLQEHARKLLWGGLRHQQELCAERDYQPVSLQRRPNQSVVPFPHR